MTVRVVLLLLALTAALPAWGKPAVVDARQTLRLLAADQGLTAAFESSLKGSVWLDVHALNRDDAVSSILRSLGWTSRRVGKVLLITKRRPHAPMSRNTENVRIPLEHVRAASVVPMLRANWPRARVEADGSMNSISVSGGYLDDVVQVRTWLEFIDGWPDVR